MIEAIITAVIVAVIVGLVLLLIGKLIAAAGSTVPLLAALGAFLDQYCWVIGLLVGLLFFVSGGRWRP